MRVGSRFIGIIGLFITRWSWCRGWVLACTWHRLLTRSLRSFRWFFSYRFVIGARGSRGSSWGSRDYRRRIRSCRIVGCPSVCMRSGWVIILNSLSAAISSSSTFVLGWSSRIPNDKMSSFIRVWARVGVIFIACILTCVLAGLVWRVLCGVSCYGTRTYCRMKTLSLVLFVLAFACLSQYSNTNHTPPQSTPPTHETASSSGTHTAPPSGKGSRVMSKSLAWLFLIRISLNLCKLGWEVVWREVGVFAFA